MTFSRACGHAANYSVGHETRTGELGSARLAYPQGHIEVDNRLSWLLGRLHDRFGDTAFYVHLRRDRNLTAQSFVDRFDKGIMAAYRSPGILMNLPTVADPMTVALDYCDTVDRNIELFLRDKTYHTAISLEEAKLRLPEFWERIGAVGDFDAALSEFDTCHNSRGS